MIKKIVPLTSLYLTGSKMLYMVKTYWHDIGIMVDWDFERYYRYIADLPYIADPKGIEALQRPKIGLSSEAYFRDCDDKAILIGSWCYGNSVPFRFIACSYEKKDRPHHAIIEVESIDGPIYVDATYPGTEYPRDREFFNIKPITKWEL